MPSRFPLPDILRRRAVPVLLCVNLLLLAFYLCFDYQIVFHSDSAAKNLLAQEIYETGQYFPRDWNYVNNDLWVLYTHTVIVPLIGWLRNGFALHALSDLVSATLILTVSWYITGLLGQSRTARLLSMLVISSGMSLIMAEHVFGQAAYGSMYGMACALLYAYWSLLHTQGRARWLWGGAVLVLSTLLFWANPQRALVYDGLPLLAAALTLGLSDHFRPGQQGPRGQGRWLLLLLAGAVAGVALHLHTIALVNNIRTASLLTWLDFNGMVNNALGTLQGLLNLLDGLPTAKGKVISPAGIYQALRLLTALTLLCLLPWSLLQALRARQRSRRYFATFTLVAAGLNLFIVLTTSLADMNAPEGSARYLVPSLLCMLILLVGELCDRPGLNRAVRAAGLAAVAVLATSAPAAYLWPYVARFSAPNAATVPTPEIELLRFLENQGLAYGYAPFWSAGNLTVLSGQRVRIRQVLFNQGLPVPMRFLSSNRWYRPQAWTGQTFLLLKDGQLPELNLELLSQYMGPPVRTLHFGVWNVLVFGANLTGLPGWDIDGRTAERFHISHRSAHLIGKVGGQPATLSATADEAGPLYFGPARDIAPGTYLVTFDLETGGPERDHGHVDVVSQSGTLVHGRQAIERNGRQQITVRFSTDRKLEPAEFRVFKNAGTTMTLHGIAFQRDLSVN